MSTRAQKSASRPEALRRETKDLTEVVVRVLDDWIQIPGTRIGVGLDPLLGLLLPVAGDLAVGIASLGLLWVAWRRRVPTITMARMVLNIAIDAVLGCLPVAGDVFDLVWRANRKNLELIQRHQQNPRAGAALADYLVLGAALAAATLALVVPIGLGLFYLSWLWAKIQANLGT
jgi:hypothetical protein